MENYIKQYRVLSDKTRMRILFLLNYTKELLCVCEIMDSLDISQYNASRHLNILKASGLVKRKKKGTWAFYSLAAPVNEFHKALLLSIASIPKEEFSGDIKRSKKRLSMRENGRCVVGMQKSNRIKNFFQERRNER